MIAWAVVSCHTACPPGLMPDSFWNFTSYLAASQELELALPRAQPGDLWSCLEAMEGDNTTLLQLGLVRVAPGRQDCSGIHSCSGRLVGCCSDCTAIAKEDSQDTVLLSTLRAWQPLKPFSFKYVGGSYALQLSEFPCAGCNLTRSWCSASAALGRREEAAECSAQEVEVLATEQSSTRNHCVLGSTVAVPVCSSLRPYTTVEVTVLTSETNDSCEAASSIFSSSKEPVSPCTTSCSNTSGPSLGLVDFSFQALPNTSYCLWLVPDTPGCRQAECGFPVPGPPRFCSTESLLRHPALPMSEPIFIATVCSVLAACLLFLLWVVVKCSRDQTTSPASSPEPDDAKKEMGLGGMPRSLTIDEMEHICRLRQQEIVLVYFPDTEKFKNLNRIFKDWLQSLNILNVNHVTDIYDEKYAESQDGILKSPETWVSNLLSDPERRVVLVTSRLAYDCLLHLRKGLAPPKFPDGDTHSDLLQHILRLLDSDMFRGNYRRLICVRYEDLKICDRRYGSESFNIVPGTEYLLPQHLEDIARWIHPVEARPSLWADQRPEVRHLLETIKTYRHQEVRQPCCREYLVNGRLGTLDCFQTGSKEILMPHFLPISHEYDP